MCICVYVNGHRLDLFWFGRNPPGEARLFICSASICHKGYSIMYMSVCGYGHRNTDVLQCQKRELELVEPKL